MIICLAKTCQSFIYHTDRPNNVIILLKIDLNLSLCLLEIEQSTFLNFNKFCLNIIKLRNVQTLIIRNWNLKMWTYWKNVGMILCRMDKNYKQMSINCFPRINFIWCFDTCMRVEVRCFLWSHTLMITYRAHIYKTPASMQF